MRKILGLWATAAILVASTAWAHGAGRHFRGTVKEATSERLVVVTEEGDVEVRLVPGTRVVRGGAPVDAARMKAGERVAVHARPADSTGLEAIEVKLAPAK